MPMPAVPLCVEQATRVRPFDGAVLFEAGQEALLAGDLDQAVARLFPDRHVYHYYPASEPDAFYSVAQTR